MVSAPLSDRGFEAVPIAWSSLLRNFNTALLIIIATCEMLGGELSMPIIL